MLIKCQINTNSKKSLSRWVKQLILVRSMEARQKKLAFLSDASAKALNPPPTFFKCKNIYMFLTQDLRPEMDDLKGKIHFVVKENY